MERKRIILFFVVFLLTLGLIYSDGVKKVKIKTSLANLRSAPSIKSKIIKTVRKGEIFEVLSQEGKWYKVALSVDKLGDPEYGFIHSSIVEVIKEKVEAKKPKITNKKEVRAESNVNSAQKNVNESKKSKEKDETFTYTQEKLFSGIFVKGGLMIVPKESAFNQNWIFSLGFDSPIGGYLTWGLEFQPYYRSFASDDDFMSLNNLYLNVFFNLKGGINFGNFSETLKFITLYIGGGIGSQLSFSKGEIAGIELNEFDKYLAWHVMYGLEIDLKFISIILEMQNNKIIDPDLDPKTQNYSYLLIGVRF